VRALIDIDIGLRQPRYRAYPVADHIADKVCAMIETHPRKSGEHAASTRYAISWTSLLSPAPARSTARRSASRFDQSLSVAGSHCQINSLIRRG